mmetsp:Transcript_12738/g.19111  ORF Transcript_12738/g.19111 Transcript_12738/m.19111 type:complete len:153 (+) Transcript_12738:834-1292(+)
MNNFLIKHKIQSKYSLNVSSTYVGMRYWYPFTEEALEQIQEDMVEALVIVTLYPQFSIRSCWILNCVRNRALSIMRDWLDVKKCFIRMKNKRSEFEEWAKEGECTNNPDFMMDSSHALILLLWKIMTSCPSITSQDLCKELASSNLLLGRNG